MNKELERIPYKQWINSQLSIAKFTGCCDINGKRYEYDREVVKQMAIDDDDDKLYKPDLVCYGK